MEDQNMALNETVETETTATESPTEEQTTEVTEDATPEVQEVPKKGAQSRIRELNSQVHSLKDRIEELTRPVGQSGYAPQFMPQPVKPLIGEDESIDSQELERRMQEREQMIIQRADAMAELRTRQIQTIERINREAEEVIIKHPELDPNSELFDEELNREIYDDIESKIKSDPSASIKSLVDRKIRLYKRGVSKEEEQINKTVAKQSSQGAIKPSQAKPVERSFNELSIAEMEAKLGLVDI